MSIALWIATGLLGLFMLGAGIMKASRPIEEIRRMPWTSNISTPMIRLIGILEILGTIGLVAPVLTGIASILTPAAAACLALLMAGATVTHVRIKDPNSAAITTAVLTAVALFIAVGRFSGLS